MVTATWKPSGGRSEDEQLRALAPLLNDVHSIAGIASAYLTESHQRVYTEDEVKSHMTVTVKSKAPLIVPQAVRRQAGFKSGDKLEFRASGGVITILRKLPAADDEYTPEQRRIIDAQLAKGLADVRAGRIFGPFDSAAEMIAHMKTQLKKGTLAKRAKRSR